MCMCLCEFMCTIYNAVTLGGQGTLDLQELELEEVLRCLVWLLGTEPGSS